MKKLAVLALTTTALLQPQTAAAATAEACPDSYLATLPQWDPDRVSVTAADPSGRYQVAQVMNTASQLSVGLWRNGVPAEVIAAASGIYIEPTDVSVRAEVVGHAYGNGSASHGWRLRGSQRTDLPQPAGVDGSRAVAVNAAGEVAGNTESGPQQQRAVAWSADNVARVLPVPDGFSATTATDIDEDGVVVGYATLYDGNMPQKQQPVVWPAVGGYRLLQTADADGWASAEAVRNGVAVGADAEAAVSWTLSDGTHTVIDADKAKATEINAGGDVVVQKTPNNLPSFAAYLRRGQQPREAGDFWVAGLSDFGKVYHQSRQVNDCG